MRAYSQDLRERVLRAVDLGRSRAEIVQCFGISLATIKRYVKQQRDEGHVRPKAIPGRPPKKRVQVEAGVLPQLQAHDDATLEQHCDLWEQTHDERVSRWTMSRAIKRLGWTRKKKSLGATERNEQERATWRENASKLPTESLVFLDECGSNIALAPLYARAPKGERARGSVPRNRGKNTTLIAALSLEGMGAALILEGSANTTAFELYIEQVKAHGFDWPSRRKAVSFSSYLAIRLTSPPLKKPSPSSKPRGSEQEPEPEKPWKRPLLRRYSLSLLRMRRDGSSIAATFSLTKGRAKCGSIFEHAAVELFAQRMSKQKEVVN